MKLIHICSVVVLAIFYGCTQAQEQQQKLVFTYSHKKSERSKDSNQSTRSFVLKGNKLTQKVKYQRRRGPKNRNQDNNMLLTDAQVEAIDNYLIKNNLYRGIATEGDKQVTPGIFHEIYLQIIKNDKTYTLSFVGGFRFGRRLVKTPALYKQLTKFESFLRKILRKEE